MLALASIIFLGLILAAVVSVAALILRVAFWTILLPFRILFGLLFLPFWIGKTVLKLAIGAVLIPVFLIGGILLAVVAAIVAIITPLLPFAIVAFLLWVVFRSFARPVTA